MSLAKPTLNGTIKMNERIRELLKQAEERYPRHLAVAVPEVVLRRDALEKFAELIVDKCIDLCNETYFKNNSDAEDWEESEESCVIREYFVGE